jgi:UDP-N-acetylmuramoyl-L-alanyl-D-glutamate--2,6-diaminopimelate ligase
MTLKELLNDIDVLKINGDVSLPVSSVSYDSRRCAEGGVFVAVSGLREDGNRFVEDALARGVRFVVSEKDLAVPPGISTVQVRNSREALGILGRNFFGNPSARLCLIGITGTNGKTTVSYLLESIFRAAGHSVGVLGTVNYRYGGITLEAPNTTPESFDMQRMLRTMADAGVSVVAAEVSSHAVDLRRVDDCAFDLGVFTNLSQDHLDYHGTMENYFAAKRRFFDVVLPRSPKRPGQVKMVVNADDPWGQEILAAASLPAWGFGLGADCPVRATLRRSSLKGLEADVLAGSEELAVQSPLIGPFNLYNILAAVAAAKAVGIETGAIRRGVADLQAVPGRLERVGRDGDPHVFVDYAHTDDALTKVLENLKPLKSGRILTVFGCGGDRDRGSALMGAAAVAGSDWSSPLGNPRSEDPLAILARWSRVPGEREPGGLDPAGWAPSLRQGLCGLSRPAFGHPRPPLVSPSADDLVLLAGKGLEDYQIVGVRRLVRRSSRAAAAWKKPHRIGRQDDERSDDTRFFRCRGPRGDRRPPNRRNAGGPNPGRFNRPPLHGGGEPLRCPPGDCL